MIGLLIRHGEPDAVSGSRAGRTPGLSLGAHGRDDATRLARALTWLPVSAVYSSPLACAVETAQPLARVHGLDVRTRAALTDVDLGDWSGRPIDELAADPRWQCFTRDRTRACPPGGEALSDVQRRVVAELLALARTHPGEMVAIVTHDEPIRCALAAFGARRLDEIATIDLTPGYVTTVGLETGLARVLSVNQSADEAAAAA